MFRSERGSNLPRTSSRFHAPYPWIRFALSNVRRRSAMRFFRETGKPILERLASDFADAFSASHGSWAAFVVSGLTAISVLFMVGVLADGGKVGIAAGYKMALPLIALACSLVLAFWTNRAPLADAFSTAASALIEMITWMVLVNVCRMAAIPSIAVFVAGRIIVHIGMLIGESAGFACLCMGYGSLFVIACIVMVVIATSVLFADTTFCDTGSELGGEEGDRDDASFDVRLRGQCGGGIVTGPDTEVRLRVEIYRGKALYFACYGQDSCMSYIRQSGSKKQA